MTTLLQLGVFFSNRCLTHILMLMILFSSIVAQCQLPLHRRQQQLLEWDVSVSCIVMVVVIHFPEQRFVVDGNNQKRKEKKKMLIGILTSSGRREFFLDSLTFLDFSLH